MREFKDSVSGKDDDDDRAPPAPPPPRSERPTRRTRRASASATPRADAKAAPRGACATARRRPSSSTSTSCARAAPDRARRARPRLRRRLRVPHTAVDWLNASRSRTTRKLITLGVAEPFFTSIKVSLRGGPRARAPGGPVAALELPRPRVEERTRSAVSSSSRSRRSSLRHRVRLLRRAAEGAGLPDQLRRGRYDIQIRARDYFSFATGCAARDRARLRAADLHLALVRLGVVTTEQLRRNRRIGYVAASPSPCCCRASTR